MAVFSRCKGSAFGLCRRGFFRGGLLALILMALTSMAQAVEDSENAAPTEWWMFSGQTAADVNGTLQTQNARIVDIKVDRASPWPFTVTYVQNTGSYAKQWWWYSEVDEATLKKLLSDNKARLTSLQAYDIGGGQIRFAVAMISNTGTDAKTWWYYTGLSSADIGRLTKTNNARLTSLRSYESNGKTLYAVIMIANTGADAKAWWWYLDLAPQSVGSQLSANKSRTLDVSYAPDGRVNMIMESCSQGCTKWAWSVGKGGNQLLAEAQQNGTKIIAADTYPGCGGYCFAATMVAGSLGSQHGSIRPPPPTITVTEARIGCLDIQKSGNLTGVVGKACDAKTSCSYKAPTEYEYKRLGVQAATRTFCTQGMQIVYNCGDNDSRTINVDGDAWDHAAAELYCPAQPPVGNVPPHSITVTTARIGCLDIQQGGNLTTLVGNACDYKTSCDYKAPTEAEYKSEGVQAATRTFCTQAMEITYQCGTGPNQIVGVPGDAWDHAPARLACLDIDPSTYRQKNGYDFVNSGAFQNMVGGYNWDNMKELYGKCSVNLDVFGFCEIPDPLLAIYIPVLNASFQSGQCFGFSLSSLRLLTQQRSLNDFPRTPGPEDIWDLEGVQFTNGGNVSPNLSHYIHLQHVLQTSAEAIHYYIDKALGEHTHQMLLQEITNALNERAGVLCMHNGGDGHCVVPYAVYPQPNGDYTIETYNPNVPYAANENHSTALAQSRITVHTNNTFEFGGNSEFHGGLDNIIYFPMSLFDSPSPPLGLGLLKVIFGGTEGPGIKTTQITDANGHTLFRSDGSWNTDPATRIPDSAALPMYGKATPGTSVFVLSNLGSYTQTIEGEAAGQYQINVAGHDFGIQLGVPSNAGDRETISYSPANNRFALTTTAASKSFNVKILVRHPDKSVRTANVIGTGLRDARLDMGFDAAKDVFTYHHAGGPAQLSVHLFHTLNNATTEIAMPQLSVAHGDTVTFKPNWTALKSAEPGIMQVMHETGASETQTLHVQ